MFVAEFGSVGDKVKVNMRFMGREMAHQEFGMKLMRKVVETLKDVANAESNPKMEGKQAFLILAPDAIKVKEYMKLLAPGNDSLHQLVWGSRPPNNIFANWKEPYNYVDNIIWYWQQYKKLYPVPEDNKKSGNTKKKKKK